MKSLSKIMAVIAMVFTFTACEAQIKNEKKETVKIYGNCNMCKSTIEKAGNVSKTAKVEWNKDTKMASIAYDQKTTNLDEILKRIALAGYDSDAFRAPDDAYAKLPECCQYDRPIKTIAKAETAHAGHAMPAPTATQEKGQLKSVFDSYFDVKDALVKTDGKMASEKAKSLVKAIGSVKMNELKADEHTVWMKVLNDLKEDAEHISETADAKHQRDHFITLSKSIYELLKVSKYEVPVYYQFCPMANDNKGANWLSKENAVKNPYYGSQMLTCGKTVETIK
jgi:Cation transport ATPase